MSRPYSFTSRFSPWSTERMPIWRISDGWIAGARPPRFTSASGPRPHRQATGMPCTLPEGVTWLVLKSAWASSQSTRSFLPVSRQWRATAVMLPTPRQWSPPSRIGRRPALSCSPMASITMRFQATTSAKWR